MASYTFLVAAMLFVSILKVDAAGEWGYSIEGTGPASWTQLGYPLCSGMKQSPIDVISSSVEDKVVGDFTLTGFAANDIPTGATWTAVNNGHAIVVEMTGDYLVSEGGLVSGTSYKATQFHFHWGNINTEGSEHFIDGKQYAGEMHVLTYNTKYADASAAVDSGDSNALAVLGFLIEIQAADNTAFSTLFDAFSRLQYHDDEYELQSPVAIRSLLPDNFDFGSYYRYSGSLTTPTCNEVVVWTVFKTPVMLSEAQIMVFRGQFSNEVGAAANHTIAYNFRPVQALNGRTIYNNVNANSAAGLYVTTASIISMVMMQMMASALTE